MSEVTSRPAVTSVSTDTVASSAVALGLATAVVMAGAALIGALRGEGADYAGQLDQTAGGAEALAPASRVRAALLDAERRTLTSALGASSPLEAHKTATLAGLNAASYVVPENSLRPQLRALLDAPTLRAAEDAREALFRTAEHAHTALLVSTVAHAARLSSVELGFSNIEVVAPADGRSARVVATTPGGRALVSEVTATAGGNLSLETEVVGVHDGSCHAILDRFDDALERYGIKGDRRRRSTGGVCELAAAREVAPILARPRPVAPAQTAVPGGRTAKKAAVPVRQGQ